MEVCVMWPLIPALSYRRNELMTSRNAITGDPESKKVTRQCMNEMCPFVKYAKSHITHISFRYVWEAWMLGWSQTILLSSLLTSNHQTILVCPRSAVPLRRLRDAYWYLHSLGHDFPVIFSSSETHPRTYYSSQFLGSLPVFNSGECDLAASFPRFLFSFISLLLLCPFPSPPISHTLAHSPPGTCFAFSSQPANVFSWGSVLLFRYSSPPVLLCLSHSLSLWLLSCLVFFSPDLRVTLVFRHHSRQCLLLSSRWWAHDDKGLLPRSQHGSRIFIDTFFSALTAYHLLWGTGRKKYKDSQDIFPYP